MLESYSKYYNEVVVQCDKFMNTMKDIRFDEKDEPAEIFLMTTINLNVNNAKSISLLLDINQFGPVIMICRNIIESFFNVHWSFEPMEKEAVKERIYALEGDPYYHLEKEIDLIDKDQLSAEPSWSKLKVEEFKKMIEGERNNYPHLLKMNKEGKAIFKNPPPFAKRMGEQRLKYYQIYIFTSLFTHPSPKLKEFYLRRITMDKSNLEIIEDALKQTLAYCIHLIQAIIGYAEIVFNEINPTGNNIRSECYKELKMIVKNANNGIVDFNKGDA